MVSKVEDQLFIYDFLHQLGRDLWPMRVEMVAIAFVPILLLVVFRKWTFGGTLFPCLWLAICVPTFIFKTTPAANGCERWSVIGAAMIAWGLGLFLSKTPTP